MSGNTFPKLHNAMWPGLVGKGEEEPPIDLNKMLDMTQAAEVDGVKFDGVDLFLADPHTSIDVDDDGIKALADNVGGRGLAIGSAVAPVWPPVGGGSAMDPGEGRTAFLGLPLTKSGATAKNVSKFRPSAPILAITPDATVACRLQLVWGVNPLVIPQHERTTHTFLAAMTKAKELGLLNQGDLVIQTAGTNSGVSGSTDLVKVGIVSSEEESVSML